jgi:glycosyltransferase involved in cell wall biosynthesis
VQTRTHHPPDLSIVVTTRGRAGQLAGLLARCNQATLAPRRFEVLVVDDGSPDPIQVDAAEYRFALTPLRQDRAGPAAARNLALEHCRGGIVLFLEDDALPAFDLFEKHLAVHASRTDRVAVLGTFEFTEAARRRPFVQVLCDSDLLYDTVRLRDGALHPWTYFWTCNLSLPLALLREAGGFDAAHFPLGVLDDLELGLRLAKRGVSVLFRKELACEHDHAYTADEYFERAVLHGVYSARLAKLHGDDPEVLRTHGAGRGGVIRSTAEAIAQATQLVEGYHAPAIDLLDKLRLLEQGDSTVPLPHGLLAQLRERTRRLSLVPFSRGQLIELAGFDPERVMHHGPARGRLTSVIVVTRDSLASLEACLARLREARETAHPVEFVVVDDGSVDGTSEFLAEQRDVRAIRHESSLGAPAARNRALLHARGENVVFLDDDARVTPGWLGRLLYHSEIDPGAGCIGPTTDRAGPGQQIVLRCHPDPASIAAFARGIARDLSRQHYPTAVLSGFCLLVPRRVLDAIGGFDERFSPAGFEGDDFTLRATLAGFRNRCARDVIVHRADEGSTRAAERRAEALRADADRFAAKWGLAPLQEADANGLHGLHGGDARLAPLLARRWSLDELRITVRGGAEHPAALPRPTPLDRESPRA